MGYVMGIDLISQKSIMVNGIFNDIISGIDFCGLPKESLQSHKVFAS